MSGTVNLEALSGLAQNAPAWAKTYVVMVEALLAAGLLEDEARDEARGAANFAAFWAKQEEEEGERCPLCGGPAVADD